MIICTLCGNIEWWGVGEYEGPMNCSRCYGVLTVEEEPTEEEFFGSCGDIN